MGLIDFVRNAGKEIFNLGKAEENVEGTHDKVKAESLTTLLNKLGLPSQNVKVSVQGEKAIVEGSAPSQEAKEKIILALGNIQGIASVDDKITVASLQSITSSPSEQSVGVFHVVKSGENLSAIAKQHYGDASKYHEIFEANKPLIKDEDEIYPGQVLRIPKKAA